MLFAFASHSTYPHAYFACWRRGWWNWAYVSNTIILQAFRLSINDRSSDASSEYCTCIFNHCVCMFFGKTNCVWYTASSLPLQHAHILLPAENNNVECVLRGACASTNVLQQCKCCCFAPRPRMRAYYLPWKVADDSSHYTVMRLAFFRSLDNSLHYAFSSIEEGMCTASGDRHVQALRRPQEPAYVQQYSRVSNCART